MLDIIPSAEEMTILVGEWVIQMRKAEHTSRRSAFCMLWHIL